MSSKIAKMTLPPRGSGRVQMTSLTTANTRLKKLQQWLSGGATRDDGGNYTDLSMDGRSLCTYFD